MTNRAQLVVGSDPVQATLRRWNTTDRSHCFHHLRSLFLFVRICFSLALASSGCSWLQQFSSTEDSVVVPSTTLSLVSSILFFFLGTISVNEMR
jgi:membrane-anchored glycerophosphoryl diester phosphodiesterase (GDPDase)